MTESRWNRRDFLGGVTLFALAVGVPVAAVSLSGLDDDDAPTERQRAMMRVVSQTVLPATGTPGAGDVGVGDFVILALAHGLDGTRDPVASSEFSWGQPQYARTDGSLRYLDWLESTLDRAGRGDWLGQAPAERERILATLDADAYADGAGDNPWKKMKALILTGYYTSETGGSKELRYELTPGRYDPKLVQGPDYVAWSSDWTAVDFG